MEENQHYTVIQRNPHLNLDCKIDVWTTYKYHGNKLLSASQTLHLSYDLDYDLRKYIVHNETYFLKLYLDEKGHTQIKTTFDVSFDFRGKKQYVSDTIDNSGLFDIVERNHTAFFPTEEDYPFSESLFLYTFLNVFESTPNLSVNITNNYDVTEIIGEDWLFGHLVKK